MSFKEEPDDVKFVCTLDDQSKKKAREELNENEKDRLGAVQSFRSLVLQQDWLRTRTDFPFLLRFLRAKKFSQLTARDTLLNYWTSKSKYPEWFANIDPADKKLQEFMRCGFYYSPLKRDRDGRRIIIERIGNINIDDVKKKFGIGTVFKNIILICEYLMWDENVQVNGVSVFVDMTGLTMAHHTHIMNLENAKKMVNFYQNGLPARMKAFHIYNEPPLFDMIFGLISPLIKEKIKSRMHFHGKNMTHAYDFIDKAVLPDEYLPDDYTGPSAGPQKQIIEDMIADMNKPEFLDYIRDVTSTKYGVDLDRSKKGTHPVASFRKLNID